MRAPLTILLHNAKSMSCTGLVGYSSSSEEGEDDKETEVEALDTGGGHLTASKCKDTATVGREKEVYSCKQNLDVAVLYHTP